MQTEASSLYVGTTEWHLWLQRHAFLACACVHDRAEGTSLKKLGALRLHQDLLLS